MGEGHAPQGGGEVDAHYHGGERDARQYCEEVDVPHDGAVHLGVLGMSPGEVLLRVQREYC
jgi:hypothetical protein